MNSYAGTGKLVRLALRRDRIIMAIWVFLIAITPISLVSTVQGVYPTEAERATYQHVTNTNPAFLANYGKIYDSSVAAVTAQRSGTMPMVNALIALLTVIRHSRTDEEMGRRELLGSTVVGRQAPLAAAMLATCGACVVVGGIVAAGMIAQGLPVAGSVALALGYIGAGFVFAAVGAIAAQLTEGAGGARGIAIAVLGVAFLLRAVGEAGQADGGGPGIAWLSPFFWPHAMQAYAGEVWWVLALFAGVFAVLTVAAIALNARRDIGAGLLPSRLGKPSAPGWLGGPVGLAWRLQRVLLVAWLLWFLVFSVFFGGMATSVSELYSESPSLAGVVAAYGGAGAIVDQFLFMMLLVSAMITSVYGVQSALRTRREEGDSRVDPVLATAVSRTRWMSSHLLFAFGGPAVGLALTGLIGGLVYASSTADSAQVARVLGAALAMVPAVWVMTAIAVALFGLAPRLTALAWAAVVAVFMLGIVGPLLDLPSWVLDLSPFAHVPALPGGEFAAGPEAWMLAITAGLVTIGVLGFRRRDIQTD